jgi:hypothetical protein
MLRVLLMASVLAGPGSGAADQPADTAAAGPVVTVELQDGSRLVGRVIAEDEDRLRVRTPSGLEVDVLRSTIATLRPASAPALSRRRPDPNYSRLMFSPTGRPLRKGDGYFSDYELVFPGFAVGVTDTFSLAGGVSTIPAIGLGEQLFYVSPKLGFNLSDRAAVSVGVLLAGAGWDDDFDSVGIAFAVGTFGSPDRSLSLGFGLARELGTDYADTEPILMLGGQARLSDSIALVSENWFLLGGDLRMSEQPLGVALRFFGERLSADVGVVLIGELLDEGFPVPWLSVSYHFGPGRAARSARRPAPMLTATGRRP